ncbi:polysaccharide deacetylase family protein [Salegentibacter sp. BLCTC]|uniref:polysaccharide deacetylase family protein n=1 Tax=Salegentibacter sp. BLCTC TaxID=2697368 RepID=UPI00187BA5D5|nr:polysaccharide deacetylase family protein [Salegentibacter sp. BLCTC]MBE7639212.1 polysaccharide deacetylase family protein [Salegentibacter sp. BLCTC]
MQGTLVISLDFELLWGVFDKVDWREKKEYFQNTRKIIPEMLKLFEKYEISCTWATVGMLFNEGWDEWNENIPKIVPAYNNMELSAYQYGQSIQSKETEALCFAPELIKFIAETPNQEIGTHTYSHYYCLEPGQGREAFKSDLKRAIRLAEKQEIEMRSLVFPRNQYNEDYLKVCAELGIANIRSNPKDWYWQDTQKDSLAQKIFRTGDAYLGPCNKSYKKEEIFQIESGVVPQMASRLLRPYSSMNTLNSLKLKRIISEMEKAARKGEIYHLWWHPHNFGNNPEANLKDLELILSRFQILRDKFGFQSKDMFKVNNNICPKN